MKYKAFILTFASVLLLSLARLPIHMGWLVFIGWIPVANALQIKDLKLKHIILMAAIWAITYTAIVLNWIALVTVGGLFGIMLFYTVVLSIFFYFAHLIWQKLPNWGWLGFSCLMISFEYLQQFGETRFPWWNMAYCLADYNLLLQVLDLGGMSLIAVLILLINHLIDKLRQRKWLALGGVVLIFALWLGYGYYSYYRIKLEAKPLAVQVMQPSIPQGEKWDEEAFDAMMAVFDSLSHEAAKDNAQLIVWPEAAIPKYLRYDAQAMYKLRRTVSDTGLDIFTGFPDFERAPAEHFDDAYYYNAASLFKPDGSPSSIYYKNILVPVGERMLWMDVFPFLAKLNFGQANWEYGKELAYYDSHGYRFSPSICYELAFDKIHHRMALPKSKQGGFDKMDFLVNLTNDAWFGTSYGPWLHMVMSRFRAIENRIQIYRSANTGISVIIDPMGSELRQAPLFEVTNLGAPLYTCPQVPILRYIYFYPAIFVVISVILALISSFKSIFMSKAKEVIR